MDHSKASGFADSRAATQVQATDGSAVWASHQKPFFKLEAGHDAVTTSRPALNLESFEVAAESQAGWAGTLESTCVVRLGPSHVPTSGHER